MLGTRFSPLGVLVLAGLVFTGLGCSSATDGDTDSAELGETGSDEAGLRGEIEFDTFQDDIGSEGQTETRRVFTSEAAYYNYFGHYSPWEVDFYTHWVVFYSAGVQSTGGYKASIEKIETSSSGQTLYVKTRLESPGDNCMVTQSLTKPYVLAKFKKPLPRPRYARYTKDDDVMYCSEPEPEPVTCATMLCGPGYHCEDRSTGGECVADPCPGAGRRSTTTGRCECRVVGICPLGTSWNQDPTVCGCE
jgi:hypothetical protein